MQKKNSPVPFPDMSGLEELQGGFVGEEKKLPFRCLAPTPSLGWISLLAGWPADGFDASGPDGVLNQLQVKSNIKDSSSL